MATTYQGYGNNPLPPDVASVQAANMPATYGGFPGSQATTSPAVKTSPMVSGSVPPNSQTVGTYFTPPPPPGGTPTMAAPTVGPGTSTQYYNPATQSYQTTPYSNPNPWSVTNGQLPPGPTSQTSPTQDYQNAGQGGEPQATNSLTSQPAQNNISGLYGALQQQQGNLQNELQANQQYYQGLGQQQTQNIQNSYGIQGQQLGQQQAQQTGSANVMSAASGAAGQSLQAGLQNQQFLQTQTLHNSEQAAITQAMQALNQGEFERANTYINQANTAFQQRLSVNSQAQDQQKLDIAKQKAQQDAQTFGLTQLKTIGETGGTVDDATKQAYDSLYGPGFTDNYLALAKEQKNLGISSTQADIQQKIIETQAAVPANESFVGPDGKTYQGTKVPTVTQIGVSQDTQLPIYGIFNPVSGQYEQVNVSGSNLNSDGSINQNSFSSGQNIPTANNNPGDIKLGSMTLAQAQQKYNDPGLTLGSTATDGGMFLHFSTPQTGKAAMATLLQSPTYQKLTVDQAMRLWSGGYSNSPTGTDSTGTYINGTLKYANGQGYGASIDASLPGTKLISQLTPDEMAGLNNAQSVAEGFGTSSNPPSNVQNQLVDQMKNVLQSVEPKLRGTPLTQLQQKLSSGDIDGAKKYIVSEAILQQDPTERAKTEDLNSGIAAYKSALDLINSHPTMSVGFWKNLTEQSKGLTGGEVPKDSLYTDLTEDLALAETPIRKQTFGSRVTPGEVNLAQAFLFNSSDNLANIKQKIQKAMDFYQYANDTKIAQQMGVPPPSLNSYQSFKNAN